MAEILVLAEHDGETVKKVTCELLTLARRFGEPSVVWAGPGAEAGRERLAEFGAATVYVAADEEFDELRGRAQGRAAGQPGRGEVARRGAGGQHRRGPGGRGPAGGEDRLRADHRRGRPRRGPGRRAVDLRRRDHRPVQGPDRDADRGGAAERGRAGAGPGGRAARERQRSGQRRREERAGHRAGGAGARRAARADRGVDRGLRRPRGGQRRELRADREARRLARRRGGRVPRRHRRGLVPAPVPGRPDREDRLARSCTWRWASPGRSSTGPACRRPRPSW